MSRSRSAFALGVVATLLAASGCSGDDPQPKVAPTEPASTSTSPSVSPSFPEAAPPSEVPAEEVVRLWVKVFNAATTSGKTDRLEAMADPSCVSCAGMVEGISRVYSSGGYTRTPGWQIERLDVLKEGDDGTVVRVRVREPAGVTQASSEAAPIRFDARRDSFEFELLPSATRWTIKRIDLLA